MVVEIVRTQIAERVRTLVSGESAQPVPAAWDPENPGLIAPDSPVRRVHGDPSMFIGGVRALLLQSIHPVAMRGVAEHSSYQVDPLGRLHRTASFVGTTTFGSADEAAKAIDIVRTVHSRVTGTLDDGTTYRAEDPDLLAWVHATEVDSFLRAYQRYSSEPLTADQADRYVADMAPIPLALGATDAPANQRELTELLQSYRPILVAGDDCRQATRFLFAPPLPLAALPFYGIVFGAAVALLPKWVRTMLLLPVGPGVDPLVLRPATRALTAALRWSIPSAPSAAPT